MPDIAGPGSGSLELIRRIEALEKENEQLKGIILWENPNPDVTFPEQDITLNSADYARYEIFFKTGDDMSFQSAYKGFGTILSSGDGNAINEHIRFRYRRVDYVDDLTLHVGNAYNANYDKTTSSNQTLAVPYKVIGFR